MVAGIVFSVLNIIQAISVYAIRQVTRESSISSKMRSINQRIIKLSSRTITMSLAFGFSYTVIVVGYKVTVQVPKVSLGQTLSLFSRLVIF